MINWKVRVKNKQFWVTLIPAVLLMIQTIATLFGWQIDVSDLSGKLLAVIDAAFGVLVILGVVTDPTTKGVSDSDRAMTYNSPQ